MPSDKYHALWRPFRNPTRHVLALAGRHLIPTLIRTLGPSLDRSLLKSAPQSTPPPKQVELDFPLGWGAGDVHEWYKKQPITRFTSLEYRKENTMLGHEFIVVRLDNGTVCRFDRRAEETRRAHAPLEEGTTSKDTARILSKIGDIDAETPSGSEVLLSLAFPDGEDLSVILAACYGIKTHPKAGAYSLFRYNCYFFSWTITCIAARRAVNWDSITQSEEPWATIVQTSLNALSPTSSRAKSANRFTKFQKLIGINKKSSTLNHLLEGTGSTEVVEKFRDLLRKPLTDIRPIAGGTIRLLLLRSQLPPRLEKLVDEHVTHAAAQVTIIAAARAAGAMAMNEVSGEYSPRSETLMYAGFHWSDHCNIAWAVAKEAANAAAEVSSNAEWAQEWDRVWQLHWDAKTLVGEADANKRLGRQACNAARDAWREEWDRINSVRQEYVPKIVEGMYHSLLEHIPDLDDKRLKLGERAAADAAKRFFGDLKAKGKGKATQPPLQDYIRTRISEHCQKVANYGFGSYGVALQSIEGAMHEVWIKTLEVMESSGSAGRSAAT